MSVDHDDLRAAAALILPAVASVAGASVFSATAGRASLPTLPAFIAMVAVMLALLLVGGTIIQRIGGGSA